MMLPKNVDISKITYNDVKSQDSGAKSVYMKYDTSDRLIIQIPKMNAPFGMSKYNMGEKVESGELEKYSLQVSLKEENKSIENFIKFLKDLDNKIINDGVENSRAWFKKSYTHEILKELYTPLVICPKDKETGEITDKYPPNFKLTVPVRDGSIICDCYNTDGEKLELSNIPKGSKVGAIIQCQGIWMAGSKFGCSWKVIQLSVTQPESFTGYCFSDDEDENDFCEEDNNVSAEQKAPSNVDDDINLGELELTRETDVDDANEVHEDENNEVTNTTAAVVSKKSSRKKSNAK